MKYEKLGRMLLASQDIGTQIQQAFTTLVAQHPDWALQDAFIDDNRIITRWVNKALVCFELMAILESVYSMGKWLDAVRLWYSNFPHEDKPEKPEQIFYKELRYQNESEIMLWLKQVLGEI